MKPDKISYDTMTDKILKEINIQVYQFRKAYDGMIPPQLTIVNGIDLMDTLKISGKVVAKATGFTTLFGLPVEESAAFRMNEFVIGMKFKVQI